MGRGTNRRGAKLSPAARDGDRARKIKSIFRVKGVGDLYIIESRFNVKIECTPCFVFPLFIAETVD